MPKSDWLPGFTIVLILLFAIYVSGGLAYQQGKREGAYGVAHQDYQDSVERAPLGGDVEAQKSDPKSYREEWRSQQDLYAQRDMAEWAWWMMIFTGGGLIATSGGLIYIALTLKATRDGNRINREIGEAQVRAYVSVTKAIFVRTKYGIETKITILNSGQSPARTCMLSNIRSTFAVDFETKTRVGTPNEFSQMIGDIPAGKERTITVPLISPKSDRILRESALDVVKFNFKFLAQISFLDVFDSRRGQEFQLLSDISPDESVYPVYWPLDGSVVIVLNNKNQLIAPPIEE